MRPFEILIALTLGIYLFWPFLTGRVNAYPFRLLPLLATVLVAGHLLFEGYRWQMIPLYILTTILLLNSLPELSITRARRFKRTGWRAAGQAMVLLLLAAAAALPALLPVPSIPAPCWDKNLRPDRLLAHRTVFWRGRSAEIHDPGLVPG